MRLGLLEAGEYVHMARLATVLVDGDESAEVVEQGQHMAFLGMDHEGVRLPGRFEDEGAGACHPVMFEVMPATREGIVRDRRGMAMAADDPVAGRLGQVDEAALRHVEQQWAAPDVLTTWHPDAFILAGRDRQSVVWGKSVSVR